MRIATERTQLLDAEPEVDSGRDPDALEAEADQIAEMEQELLAELEAARETLEYARAELSERENLAAEAERAHRAAARAEAEAAIGAVPSVAVAPPMVVPPLLDAPAPA